MQRAAVAAVAALHALLTAAPASAQTRPAPIGPAGDPRIVLTLDAGIQPAGSAVTDRLEWEQYLETASADIDYDARSAPWFGGSLGVRLWKRLGAGVAFTTFSREDAAAIEARVPHPFHFEQLREFSGEVDGLDASETAIHGQVLFFMPTRGPLRMTLSAGPSRIEAERAIVTGVQFDESFPFDTATFRTADRRVLTESKVGFHVGADVAFMFTRAFGIGGMVRFSRAEIEFTRPDGGRVPVEAGGVQAGAGLRLAFGGGTRAGARRR